MRDVGKFHVISAKSRCQSGIDVTAIAPAGSVAYLVACMCVCVCVCVCVCARVCYVRMCACSAILFSLCLCVCESYQASSDTRCSCLFAGGILRWIGVRP